MTLEPFTCSGDIHKVRSLDWMHAILQYACDDATRDPENPIEPWEQYTASELPVFTGVAAMALDSEADAHRVAKKAKERAAREVPNVATWVCLHPKRRLWLVCMDCDSNL